MKSGISQIVKANCTAKIREDNCVTSSIDTILRCFLCILGQGRALDGAGDILLSSTRLPSETARGGSGQTTLPRMTNDPTGEN